MSPVLGIGYPVYWRNSARNRLSQSLWLDLMRIGSVLPGMPAEQLGMQSSCEE